MLGNKIYIEVKSTKGEKFSNVELTDNEWNGAKNEGYKYCIYLVINALNAKIRISEKITNPFKLTEDGYITISPSIYKLDL